MVSFFFPKKKVRAKSSSRADFFLTNHKAPHWLLSQHIIPFPANPSYLRVQRMPNPFTWVRGRPSRGTAKSSLRWKPAGRVLSGGTPELAPWDPARKWGGTGEAQVLFFLLRSHTSQRQHDGSCGMQEHLPAEPILISFPTPTAGWSHSPPCAFSGCQQGEAKDPTHL